MSDATKASSKPIAGILMSLMDEPKIYQLPENERQGFLDVIGGLAALGLRPRWLERETRLLSSEKGLVNIKIPTPSGTLIAKAEVRSANPGTKDEADVNLLHLVCRSILGKCIKLGDLFQEAPHAAPDASMDRVLQGIGEVDEVVALKIHLIRKIAPEYEDVLQTTGDRQTYLRRLDRCFRQVLAKIDFAYREGYPWYLTDPAHAGRLRLLRDMGLHKVIVLLPKDGDFNDFFEDFTNAMSAVLKIHLRLKGGVRKVHYG
jgi:hypothetical protein